MNDIIDDIESNSPALLNASPDPRISQNQRTLTKNPLISNHQPGIELSGLKIKKYNDATISSNERPLPE